jgi:hypothetical protein
LRFPSSTGTSTLKAVGPGSASSFNVLKVPPVIDPNFSYAQSGLLHSWPVSCPLRVLQGRELRQPDLIAREVRREKPVFRDHPELLAVVSCDVVLRPMSDVSATCIMPMRYGPAA